MKYVIGFILLAALVGGIAIAIRSLVRSIKQWRSSKSQVKEVRVDEVSDDQSSVAPKD